MTGNKFQLPLHFFGLGAILIYDILKLRSVYPPLFLLGLESLVFMGETETVRMKEAIAAVTTGDAATAQSSAVDSQDTIELLR